LRISFVQRSPCSSAALHALLVSTPRPHLKGAVAHSGSDAWNNVRENYLAEKEEIIGDLHWKASGWVIAVPLQLCPQTEVHFSTPTPKILSIAHASPLDSLALICHRRPPSSPSPPLPQIIGQHARPHPGHQRAGEHGRQRHLRLFPVPIKVTSLLMFTSTATIAPTKNPRNRAMLGWRCHHTAVSIHAVSTRLGFRVQGYVGRGANPRQCRVLHEMHMLGGQLFGVLCLCYKSPAPP